MQLHETRYWLNLFTGSTWQAFRDDGASVCGFTARWRKIAESISPGDYFVCYLTGVMRWVGFLEVSRTCMKENGPAWTQVSFPLLFGVKPMILLAPEYGVPLAQLEGKVDFFLKPEDRRGYKQFLRSCPNEFRRKECPSNH
jgi:hypothetical protein